MKKLLLTIFLFTGLSSLALSHNGTGGILATHGEGYAAVAESSLFVGGQPENSVVFYPNPVKDFMSVRFPNRGNHTVRIYNIIGESISETPALYKWLTSKSLNGKMDSEVKWNFQKYLIDEKGNLIGMYESKIKPDAPEIIKEIEGRR